MNLAVFDCEAYNKKYNIMEYYFNCPFGGESLRCSFGGPESWLLMEEDQKVLLALNATISCVWRVSNNKSVKEKKLTVEELVVEYLTKYFDRIQESMFIQDYSKAQVYMAILSKYMADFSPSMLDSYNDLDRQLEGLAEKVEIIEEEAE